MFLEEDIIRKQQPTNEHDDTHLSEHEREEDLESISEFLSACCLL